MLHIAKSKNWLISGYNLCVNLIFRETAILCTVIYEAIEENPNLCVQSDFTSKIVAHDANQRHVSAMFGLDRLEEAGTRGRSAAGDLHQDEATKKILRSDKRLLLSLNFNHAKYV